MASSVKSRKQGCCSVQLVKNFSHIFNIIFFVGGVAALSVGLWTVITKHEYVPLLSTVTYPLTAYILAGAGILSILSALAGCCTVHRENRCFLLLYIFLLLLIFLLEAMVGVLAYVYREQVQSELQHNMNKTFTHYYYLDEDKTRAIDLMQQQYKCCGATSYENWEYSHWLKESQTSNLVPDSCCKTPSPGCGKSRHPSNIPYTGCIHAFTERLKQQLVIVCALSLGISVIPIFGMILSCCIYIKLRTYAYEY